MQKIRMIDIETTSLNMKAQVWQVGFCDFTMYFDVNSQGIAIENYGDFNMQFVSGRQADDDTISKMKEWGTFEYFDKARMSSNGQIKPDHHDYVEITKWATLLQWFRDIDGNRRIAAKWVDFDLGLIRCSLESVGLPSHSEGGPWHHRNKLCLGTIQNEYLDAGKGRSLDFAYEYAERMLAVRHPDLVDSAVHLGKYDAVYQAYLMFAVKCATAGYEVCT